jgi:hypothetical protein
MKVAAGMLCSGTLCIGLLAVALAAADLGDTPTIYRCGGEHVVYSDRPCGADASTHPIDGSRVTIYEAPSAQHASAPTPKKAASRPSNTGRKAAASHEQRQAKCNKLNQSLRDLRTKMRTGYGVEEGERLKARYRRLTEQRRAEKCR